MTEAADPCRPFPSVKIEAYVAILREYCSNTHITDATAENFTTSLEVSSTTASCPVTITTSHFRNTSLTPGPLLHERSTQTPLSFTYLPEVSAIPLHKCSDLAIGAL